MKKYVVLTMVVALFIGIPFCAFAQEEPRNAAKWCKQFAVSYPGQFEVLYKNLGYCVSSLQACSEYGNPPAVCFCRQFRFAFPQDYETEFGTEGLAPCIASFRAGPSPQ